MPNSFARDLRLAIRRLRRAPLFTLSATLTLALGIGGATAAFAVVNAVLFRPLPYRDASRLVDLAHSITLSGNTMRIELSDATYLIYQRDQRSFDDLGIYRSTAVNLVASPRSDGSAAAARIESASLTPSVFHVLGVSPVRGRGLVESDGVPGAAPVVAIGYGLWQSTFGGDAGIIGRRIVVDGVESDVVGVMPARFSFPDGRTSVWTPLRIDPARTKSSAFDFRGIGRLRAGVTTQAASAELQRLLPRVPVEFPGRLTPAALTMTHMQAYVRPLRDIVIGDATQPLWIAAGAVAALLVLVLANVANLFLARAEGRQHETAVRRALGASRSALFADLSAESIIVATTGGVIGIAIAATAMSVLQSARFGASIPRLVEVRLDSAAVVFAIAASTVAALVAGWLPMLRVGRLSTSAVLVAEGPRAAGGRRGHRVRRTLIVSQLSLALMLLTAAGLFARSFLRLRDVNPGFDASHAMAFRLALPEVTYASGPAVASVVVQTVDALRAEPGVQAVGVITKLPLDADARQDSAVYVEDHPLAMGVIPNLHAMAFASPEYFSAMGIPVIAGRLFDPLDPGRDLTRAPHDVVVSVAFTKKYWPNPQAAVGRHIKMNPAEEWATIVGVVGDVRDNGLTEPAGEVVYSSLMTIAPTGRAWAPRDLAFVVRGADDKSLAATAIATTVRSAVPTVPVYRTISLDALQADASARTTFTLAVIGVAALLALVIGAVGLYGVTAYVVGLQTRELGVRMALGATPADVRRLVLDRALRDTAIGVAVGLVGAVLLGRTIAAALYGVTASDPAALVGACVLLLATALIATWIPARRASRLDPASVLRAD